MMNEVFNLTLPFVEGIILGVIFFLGLLWTVKKVVSAKQPAFLCLGSFFLRMAIVLAGFYFAAGGHWDRLLVCFFGFIIVRCIVTRLASLPVKCQTLSTKESEDAS